MGRHAKGHHQAQESLGRSTGAAAKEYIMLYKTIYKMCTQKPPQDYSQQLYDRYRESFEEYINSTTVQHELLTKYENQLLEKEHSGCDALLRDDKVEDLSRMYRLFCRISRGLEPVAAIFRQHVTDEGTMLVKQAGDAASSNKGEKKDSVGAQE